MIRPNSPSKPYASPRVVPNERGILDQRPLPDASFDGLWESIHLPTGLKDRLHAQAILNFTARSALREASLPLHGIILLVGPPGTGKTTIGRGLASRVARSLTGGATYIEVDPHALASAALGKSQQSVTHLLGTVIAEAAAQGPCIVLLDEVETLAASRQKLSLEANPIDVHRATDAVLAQLDQLAASTDQVLFIATSNFVGALDDAFVSRADMVVTVDLPTEEVCRAILRDTLERIGRTYSAVKSLLKNPTIEESARACVGLDGRQIRKAVVAALAHSKQIAVNPNLLTADAVLEAIQNAKRERASQGRR